MMAMIGLFMYIFLLCLLAPNLLNLLNIIIEHLIAAILAHHVSIFVEYVYLWKLF